MSKLPPLATPPRIFSTETNLKVYLDLVAVEEKYGSATSGKGLQLLQAFYRSLEEFRKLNIFKSITSTSSSSACDIFVTLSPMIETEEEEAHMQDKVGNTRFLRHASGKDYAEVRLDSTADWIFTGFRWAFWRYNPRFERWLNHEMLHAIGCPHTTDRVADVPSILDEEDWMNNTAVIPNFDRALARHVYDLSDPFEKYL